MLIGVAVFGLLSDLLLKRKAAANGGELKPEYRLQLMLPGVFLIPVSLFSYGWTVEHSIFWFFPVFCTSLLGFSLNTTFVSLVLAPESGPVFRSPQTNASHNADVDTNVYS